MERCKVCGKPTADIYGTVFYRGLPFLSVHKSYRPAYSRDTITLCMGRKDPKDKTSYIVDGLAMTAAEALVTAAQLQMAVMDDPGFAEYYGRHLKAGLRDLAKKRWKRTARHVTEVQRRKRAKRN